MGKASSILMSMAVAAVLSSPVRAQLVSFPGAEGAGRLASGGRGGDVYKVVNLNDSGAGSLRFGIQNAPAGGRTIVFDVSGTINLLSSLDFNGKDNITIAGQTAPAGGITLAGHRVRINDANNIVMQFVRVRPGNTFGSQDPDAIWVQTSTNVMLDHITASWGVDETISTTHDSNNVTVQWSTISQGLYDGGHSEGDGHSYGSLINGGAYTYHHNLYAHNKSRNPRAQASGNYLRLDFVNNVMFNPQDRFGYSDSNDPFDVNLVGNYAIKGPVSSSNNALFRPDDDASKFYTEGNFTDIVRDGDLNGTLVDEGAVFNSTDVAGVDYTLSPTRLSPFNLPSVTTDSAEDAYIQVLSRAGSSNYRDSVDRRLIRSIINQMDLSIDTQTEMGGWPTLPSGSPQADSNSDGVPDSWAMSNFGNSSTPLNTTYAPSGYTYLEEYIHSLTPRRDPAAPMVLHTIPAAADAQINENNGVSSGSGSGPSLDAIWSGSSGASNQMIVLRFDLSGTELGMVANAQLQLTADSAITGAHQFKVYGLEHDAVGFDWDENSVAFNSMTGVTFDGTAGTLGINPTYNATNPIDLPNLLRLGEFTINGANAGQMVSFENPNLEVFLNLAAYFQDGSEEGLVTLILEQINNSGADPASFYSKEGNPLLAPRLVLQALAPAEVTENADFDGDGDVDGRDFLIWQRGFGEAGSLATGDANSDGNVNSDDLAIWQDQYGTVPELTANVTVPEPTGLLLVAGMAFLVCLQRGKST